MTLRHLEAPPEGKSRKLTLGMSPRLERCASERRGVMNGDIAEVHGPSKTVEGRPRVFQGDPKSGLSGSEVCIDLPRGAAGRLLGSRTRGEDVSPVPIGGILSHDSREVKNK